MIGLLREKCDFLKAPNVIGREAYRVLLESPGHSLEEISQAEAHAKADPTCREEAHRVFAEMRAGLDLAVHEATLEALSELPPPSGQPSY